MSTEIEPNPNNAANNAREEGRKFAAISCPRYQSIHSLHGPCKLPPSGNFRFNELHISRLDVKVDGHTEHLFIAILNGSAVGQVIAKHAYDQELTRAWNLRMLYIMPVHRHKGVATRLFQAVEQFARREKATQLELCVLKGNTPGRRFWIHKAKFIDDPEREAGGARSAEYACMVRTL